MRAPVTTLATIALAVVFACIAPAKAHAKGATPRVPVPVQAPMGAPFTKVTRADDEWRRLLNPNQFNVLRREGTEIAFTGAYWNEHRKGTYLCAGCGLVLFAADTKFESGTGWPSFWRPAFKGNVVEMTDASLGVVRDAVACGRCGGHLGHVFDDGPPPTGMRYCINSAALKFVPAR